MKLTLASLVLAAGSVASAAQTISHQAVNPNAVTPIATALNHISLIELPEPIMRAAVGSDDFRIECHGNTVALKPLKQGQATNLFVWTEHTQSTYEILSPGEVSSAAFVIDETDARGMSKPQALKPDESDVDVQKAENTLVAQAMLESKAVSSRSVKDSKDHVNVRITEVTRGKDVLYVRYTVSNPGKHPYRVNDPQVYRLTPKLASEHVAAFKGMQIPEQGMSMFGGVSADTLVVEEASISDRDLNPGQTVEGVLCFTGGDEPQIYRFVFANDEIHPVDAAAVL
jgi:hypothetical protein